MRLFMLPRWGRVFGLVAFLTCCAVYGHTQNQQAPTEATNSQRIVRPLVLQETRYRVRPGEAIRLVAPRETLDFVLGAKSRSIRIEGQEGQGIVVGPSASGNEVLLVASLRMKPGEYTVDLSFVNDVAEERVTRLAVTLDPLQPVPSTATKPPVILLNGWQFDPLDLNSCPISTSSADAFGTLSQNLQSNGVPVVYFFDNCVEVRNGLIEDLGNALRDVLNLIRYDTGALVPQVDLVGHSIGGLIVRSYLAGLQTNGSLSPPINSRVRKFIEISVPNFGSFVAENYSAFISGGTQSAEMIPGSPFLWSLSTWNQRGDDMHGVDSLAIIGNAGTWSSGLFFPDTLSHAGDGIVSLTSASLGFARDASRTRILPYCHTDPGVLTFFVDCSGSGIGKAPETAQIVLSFLADTPNWTSIGTTPTTDQYLSKDGGVYFGLVTATGQSVSDLTQVTFGTATLQNGEAAGSVFFNEFVVGGTGTFQATSKSLGQVPYGPFAESVGRYSIARAKLGPAIFSVGPLQANTSGWIVASGATITIGGAGFGTQQCAACQVLAGGVPLQVPSWSDQTITAVLPATYNGLVQLVVQTASGTDAINLMAAAPGAPPTINPGGTVNGASFTLTSPSLAPGSIAAIFGFNLSDGTVCIPDSCGPNFDSNGKVIPTLAGATVSFNIARFLQGIAAPILSTPSSSQLNVQIPVELAGVASAEVQVTVNGQSNASSTVSLAPVSPGLIAANSTGAGQGAILNDKDANQGVQSLVAPAVSGSTAHPASVGDVIEIYGTGLGAVTPLVPTGTRPQGLPQTVTKPIVTIGGIPATVSFSGLAGCCVGLNQVNVVVPPGIPASNAVPVVLSIGGVQSNTVTIAVQ